MAPRLAEKGIHVFPCLPHGKEPLTPKGFLDASADPEQIARWCKQYPNGNIGIATGASGLTVLDVDCKPHHNGRAAYAELLKQMPEIKETLVARTGRGGLHLYYKTPEGVELPSNNSNKFAEGIDVLSRTGYVMAPPSIHPDTGKTYEFINAVPPAEIPPRLLDLLKEKLCSGVINQGPKPGSDKHFIPSGEHNDFLWRRACSMRAHGDDEETIYASLAVVNAIRCVPPVPDDEIADYARRASQYTPNQATYQRDKKEISDRLNAPDVGRKKLDLITFAQVTEEELDWLWYGRIAYGKFQLLIGMPGKTKTYLACSISAHVTTGTPLPDDAMNLNPSPHSVLFMTYEDGLGDTLKPRLRKCGADLSKVYTISMEDQAFTTKDIPALEAAIREHPEIRLVVIDPVQNMMIGTDGNNDESVRQALNPLLQMAGKLNVAVLGIKHLNKDEKASIDNRVGGSIGYAGMARSILLAGLDNEKERGPNGETYAGVLPTKGNLHGQASGIVYEINNHGLTFHGVDRTLSVERLLPKKKDKDD
jgi:hypothetical protein